LEKAMGIAGSVWRLDTAPILFLIIVCFVSIKPSSSDQICEAFDQGSCPEDTCCSDSECLKEGGEYQCSPKGPEGPGFSNCPKCINCQWEDWSNCTVTDFEQKCGDGLSPKNVTGQKTRKHRTQTDGQGNQVVTGPGGICNGTIINGIEYDTKAPCEVPCPEHCQLSNWTTTSDWSNPSHVPPCGSRTQKRMIIARPKHNGTTCEKKYNCTTDCYILNENEPCPDFCTDGILNHGEEGVDCGGPNCPACSSPVGLIIGIVSAIVILIVVVAAVFKKDVIKAKLNV